MRIRLKLAILQSGHSQRQVGAATRIPENRLSSIVRGWTAPRDEERLALQQHLGVGPDVFQSDSRALENRSGRR